MNWLARTALLAALVWAPFAAAAELERYGLFIGANRGNSDELELAFAQADAAKLSEVLQGVGGLRAEQSVLLREPSADAVQQALISLNERIRQQTDAGHPSLLFVYYSGHGDAENLHLGRSALSVRRLEQLVSGSAATFRVLVLDACRSGALTRVKGVRQAPPIPIVLGERVTGEGAIFLTSSSADEDSQESEELSGSFFTHYLASGLLGAADLNGDDRITLSEAYRYASERTVQASSRTWAGAQHPTFQYQLKGQSDVVLSMPNRPGSERARLVLPAGTRYFVFSRDASGPMMAEVGPAAAPLSLSLLPGPYFLRGRTPSALLEGELTLESGERHVVDERKLTRIEYARLVRKGAGERRVVQSAQGGYFVRTALSPGSTACQGAFGGYGLTLPRVSLRARVTACGGSRTAEAFTERLLDVGLSLRAAYAWDFAIITLEAGLFAGADLLSQRFETDGLAPPRLGVAGHVGLSVGASRELVWGVSVVLEVNASSFIFREQRGPTPATIQWATVLSGAAIIGLEKAW